MEWIHEDIRLSSRIAGFSCFALVFGVMTAERFQLEWLFYPWTLELETDDSFTINAASENKSIQYVGQPQIKDQAGMA